MVVSHPKKRRKCVAEVLRKSLPELPQIFQETAENSQKHLRKSLAEVVRKLRKGLSQPAEKHAFFAEAEMRKSPIM